MARTTGQGKVRELQRTLYRAAKADPGRRFHALYDKVHRRDLLERAWGLVRANRGTAGIDRQTIADVERCGRPRCRLGRTRSRRGLREPNWPFHRARGSSESILLGGRTQPIVLLIITVAGSREPTGSSVNEHGPSDHGAALG